MFNELAEFIEINIGEKLRGKVAQGNAGRETAYHPLQEKITLLGKTISRLDILKFLHKKDPLEFEINS